MSNGLLSDSCTLTYYLRGSYRDCRTQPKAKQTLSTSAILHSAFEHLKGTIFSQQFVPFKFHPKNATFEPGADDLRTYIKQIIVEEPQSTDQEEKTHDISVEAYTLEITENGLILIKTISYHGVLHAFNSVTQLFYAHSCCDKEVYTPYAPVMIKDWPLFEHRGLNLDIARNRISPKDVTRTLEIMSFTKLNYLHLHATDAQSWPLEIPALPELARKGAYHQSQIWTTADLKEVQEYGVHRGVEVYVEVDMPGHTASISHAYPELITAYNKQPWGPYAQEPPSGQLQLNSLDVRRFLTMLLSDLLPRVSLHSSHFHIGGDELNAEAYNLDPTVKSSSKAVIRPLLQAFFDHVISHTSSHSLTPVLREEALLEWDLDLPKDTIIQTWRSHSSVASVVAKGHRALFGPCAHWYLDCGYGTWLDPDPSNAETSIKPPYLDWCSPYKNWRQVYSYNPWADVPEEHKHLVLGGEVHLFGELTDSVTLDGMLWPRAAAAAEVLWKGTCEVNEKATRRLAELRERLVAKAIGAGMVQMEWCLSNPGGSFL